MGILEPTRKKSEINPWKDYKLNIKAQDGIVDEMQIIENIIKENIDKFNMPSLASKKCKIKETISSRGKTTDRSLI